MDGTIRVAVCDDAIAVKLFYRQVLEEEGDMEVVSSTSTGREALDELSRHQPDALVREIRERAPATAIVLISNMPESGVGDEAERIGVDRWMPKAQKPEDLRAAVREAVAAAA